MRAKTSTVEANPLHIPDNVYIMAHLDSALRITRDFTETKNHELSVAQAELEKTLHHWGHNVDITAYPFYCSDCDVEIGRTF